MILGLLYECTEVELRSDDFDELVFIYVKLYQSKGR